MIRTFALLACLLAASRTDASIITYTMDFTYTGDLGRYPVSNVPVEIVMTADTATVGPVFFGPTSTYYPGNVILTSSVTIAGMGMGSFVSPTYIVAITGNGQTNFVLAQTDRYYGYGAGIPFAGVAVAGSYPDALVTDTGVLAGSGGFRGYSFETTLGTLSLYPTGPSSTSTFRAQFVPEPASVAMLAVGLAGAGTVVRMRRRS